MYSRKKTIGIACAFAFLIQTFSVLLADIAICPSCGYEVPEGSGVCDHCNARLPDNEDDGGSVQNREEVEEEEDAGREEFFIEAETVLAESRAGDVYLKKGMPWTAGLFYRNALALNMLAGSEDSQKSRRARNLTRSLNGCWKLWKAFRRKCPVCGGSGKAKMLTTSLDGKTSYTEVHGRACRNCRGKGFILSVGTDSERKSARNAAFNEYVKVQKNRGYVQSHSAWMPSNAQKSLFLRQGVALRRVLAERCPACMGFGKVDCAACGGTGRVKCRAPGCVDGMIEKRIKSSLMDSGLTQRTKCRTCGGRGTVSCGNCGGKGSVVCGKCNGTGDRPECGSCDGRGTLACSRCKGAGKYKGETCSECGGEGIVICPSCKGDGRK